MRLLAVRLQNLNSLRGTHEIRLDSPPLAGCGVFLITGPTGAGKSTLLDALTLALFGRAARYGKTSPDEMMSRHAGESFAEVDFESGGRTYRAIWRMRRAHGKPSGKLQPVERRLAALPDGSALAEKAAEVDALVESLSGLNYDRFLRSVLLAQGQFAAFLKARPAERADLLEQITGTEIYSALSQRAHAEHAARQQEVDALRLQAAARPVMSPEARAQEERALADAITALADATDRLSRARAVSDEMERRGSIQREVAALAARIQALDAAASTVAERLTAHAKVVATAAEQLATTTTARTTREPIWAEVIRLDAIAEQRAAAAISAAQAAERARSASESARTTAAEAAHTLDRTQAAAAADKAWLAEHVADAPLADALPTLRDLAHSWREAGLRLSQAEKLAADAARLIATADAAALSAHEFEGELASARLRLDGAVARVADEITRRDAQRRVVDAALKVQGLDDHRAQLAPGEPCPLCGAIEHPWAIDGATEPLTAQADSVRRILASLEQSLATSRQEEKSLVGAVGRLEAKATGERKSEAAARQQAASLAPPDPAALNALRAEVAAWESRARAALVPWRLAITNSSEMPAALSALEARTRQFREVQQKDAGAEKSIALATAARKAAESDFAKATAALTAADLAAAEAARLADEIRAQRREMFGDTQVDADRAHHDRLIREAQASLDAARQRDGELKAEQTEFHTRRHQMAERQAEIIAQSAGQPPVTDEAREAAAAECRTFEADVIRRNQDVGGRRQRLESDDSLRTAAAADASNLAHLVRELERWGRLRELIGSADGSKFSRFAQSLSLRQLVSRANTHLSRLAPRYRLTSAEGEELDLRIVDLFQANAERPMESLSGGESFLASLALALGLSELASRHHPIDSLFIDEGFGSLDAESLEVALAALENLQARGKTIGLISHVDLVKERLAIQVRVVREAGGTSRLEVVG